MAALIKGVFTAASNAAGLGSGDSTLDVGTKLESFLTTLVTYPFLHLAATAPLASKPGASNARPGGAGPISSAAEHLTRTWGRRGAGAEPVPAEAGSSGLSDYAEGKALVTLERWCGEPVVASRIDDAVFKAREWLLAAALWQEQDLQAMQQQQLKAGGGEYAGAFTNSPEVKQVLIKAMQLAVRGMDMYLGQLPPLPSLDQVVLQQLATSKYSVAGANGLQMNNLQPVSLASKPPLEAGAVGGEAGVEAGPVEQLGLAVAPHVRFITQQLQRKHVLSRSKTLVEWLNVLLGVVRMWLNGIAFWFYLLATGLRILGNGLSALGGLVAFTVVLSIVISVLSALTFLAASACDATGTFLEFIARFTDLAKRRTAARRVGPPHLQDKMGSQRLTAMSLEDLEGFFTLQLAHPGPRGVRGFITPGGMPGTLAGPGPSLRSRPDVPRLAADPLLVMSYDAGLVDAGGALQPHVTPDDVATLWDPEGFFGSASNNTRKAGAVLLLRLLAWKQIASIMAPPTMAGTGVTDAERALRFVFVAGVRGAGMSTLYKALTGMPQQYQVKSGGHAAEMKPILHHRSSFALLCRDDASMPGQWITRPSHGVVSCLVFVVNAGTSPTALGLAELGSTHALPPPPVPPQGAQAAGLTPSAAAPAGSSLPGGGPHSQLDAVWQALALRKPVLLLINQASSLGQQQTVDSVLLAWRCSLKEEAARRGLEADDITVMLTELLGVPPPGAVGVPQVEDWLEQTLAQSPQLR